MPVVCISRWSQTEISMEQDRVMWVMLEQVLRDLRFRGHRSRCVL